MPNAWLFYFNSYQTNLLLWILMLFGHFITKIKKIEKGLLLVVKVGCPSSTSPVCWAPLLIDYYFVVAPECNHRPLKGSLLYSIANHKEENGIALPYWPMTSNALPVKLKPTCPVLVASNVQSGMVLESWTIQLFILSLRLRSTINWHKKLLRLLALII